MYYYHNDSTLYKNMVIQPHPPLSHDIFWVDLNFDKENKIISISKTIRCTISIMILSVINILVMIYLKKAIECLFNAKILGIGSILLMK